MLRTFSEEVHCTPTELADEFWNMDAKDQLIVLHALNNRFFKNKNNDGLLQLAFMADFMRKNLANDYSLDIKHFVSHLYDYLVKE